MLYRYSCEQNQAVKTYLLGHLKEKFGNGHSPRRMRSEIYIHVPS